MKKKLCVIGNPITHSLSPQIQKFIFSNFKKKINYKKLRIKKFETYKKIIELKINKFKGINITSPLKEIIKKICNFKEKKTQSLNTLYIKKNMIIGNNTDAIGFYKDCIIKKINFKKKTLLIGLGGTAKAILKIFKKKKIKTYIFNRTNKKKIFKKYKKYIILKKKINKKKFNLIIDSTSSVLKNKLPCCMNIKKKGIIYSLNYKNIKTYKKKLINNKIKIISGIGMLFEQAFYSFLIWEKKIIALKNKIFLLKKYFIKKTINKMKKRKALNYHLKKTPGKISIKPTKKIKNKKDLSLAYSPGVAYPCEEIFKNKDLSYKFTSRGNLVGVISNGTAVLGLGNIGACASKPVMEGKAVLFKRFSNIDSYDIEIDEKNPKKLIKIIKSLEYTFGGINLEDIKSPDCFFVEKECKKKMKIPVFHDDQHGTAVVVSAALLGCLKILKKKINKIKVVVSGAGAAAIACVKLLINLGVKKKNLTMFDLYGVLYKGRNNLDKYKESFCLKKSKKKIKLEDALYGCDFFLGLSAGGVLSGKIIKKMKKNPIIFALANPYPEIFPEEAKKSRKDAIIATGRTDYINQVNNVLCFPFIFRGALDVRANYISKSMKIAAAKAIFKISKKKLNKEEIITNIFNKKLITKIPYEVAKAAIKEKNSKFKKFNIKNYKKYLNNIKNKIENEYN